MKESGYGMFEIPIEVFFNGTNETYKLNYYLELQPPEDQRPFCKLRKETLTFYNPKNEFRKHLIEYGGVIKQIDSNESSSSSNKEESLFDRAYEQTIKKEKKVRIFNLF